MPKPAPSKPSLDLTELLGYRLNRLSASIGQRADLDAAHIAGLTLPEYRVMVTLLSRGPQGVAGLQQTLLIDKAWISRTLAKLVDKALLAAVADPHDGRRITFELTPTGTQAAQALAARARQRQKKILRNFSAQDRMQLLSLLDRVQRNVDEWKD